MQNVEYLDVLYGKISQSEALVSLIKCPLVQRLRHVRLSNIDSLASPGVSGISRYEHSIGVAHLASKMTFLPSLTDIERNCFLAAALLHDSAITPYGHLVEEAMQYVGENTSHEEKWSLLRSNEIVEVGGVDLQIYCGRESGLKNWAFKIFGEIFENAIDNIFNMIQGVGILGKLIKGKIDLDNIDNVPRAAYHMGINFDRRLPIRILQGIHISENGNDVLFSEKIIPDLESWLKLRGEVYNRFMLSDTDFAGKIMLISATISALKHKKLHKDDWKLADFEYIEKLLSCDEEAIRNPINNWLLGDLWPISNLVWFKGGKPSYSDLLKFSTKLSEEIKRECLAYGIQDKRSRQLVVKLCNMDIRVIGYNPDKWLLGVGSPNRKPFKVNENRVILDLAKKEFGWEYLPSSGENNLSLFNL